MMNRSDRDNLLQALTTTKQRIEQIARTLFLRKVPAAAQTLQELCDIIDKALSKEHAALYTEPLLSLIAVMQGFEKQKMPIREKVEALSLMGDIIDGVRSRLAEETEIKKEIYFLPYKASMWDSLESIWRAAAKDTENCNAHVVPIPYADRNPDGSAAQWHCERGIFPADVPVENWEDVDLKAIHPDTIYIHNPYDGMNLVTSVDGRYYSDKLKQYTEKLIYVPYFLIGDRWPESHTELSCYRNMDYMIVQRDMILVAKGFLSSLKETDEILLGSLSHLKGKLLPLGTPKIDRLFYCEEHKQVPYEWKDYIRGKKVLLYNTTISGFLIYKEQYLKKMAYVFDNFRNNDRVALIWRPHPLLESTMESMCPEILPQYQKLKKEFLQEHIGIFDTTPDISMAVAIADAYIGDSGSSVVSLFGYTGKSMFFTDNYYLVQSAGKIEKAKAFFTFSLTSESKQYVYEENHNLLCQYDSKTDCIKEVAQIKGYPFGNGFFSGVCDSGDKFCFSPANAKEIVFYDKKTKKLEKVPFKRPLEYGNFFGVISYGEKLYFIPRRYPAIMCCETTTHGLTYYDECFDQLRSLNTGFHDEFFGGYLQMGTELLLASLCTNVVIGFDLENKKFHNYGQIGPADTDCVKIIAENDEIIWLIPYRSRKIRRWNRKTGECEVVESYPSGYACDVDRVTGETWMFVDAVSVDGAIWLFPAYGNMILYLNMAEKTIKEAALLLPHKITERKTSFFWRQFHFNGVILTGKHEITVQAVYDGSLWVIDTEKLTVCEKKGTFTAEQLAELQPSVAEQYGPLPGIPWALRENPATCSIADYVEYIVNAEHDRQKQREIFGRIAVNGDGSCGEKVHSFIMGELR